MAGGGDFAAAAVSLLTAIGMLASNVEELEAGLVRRYQDGVTWMPLSDAVLVDAWPTSAGTMAMEHIDRRVVIRNAVRGRGATIAAGAVDIPALDVCLTVDRPLDSEIVDHVLQDIRASSASASVGASMRVHVVVCGDCQAAVSPTIASEQQRQIFRHLQRKHGSHFAHWLEVHLGSSGGGFNQSSTGLHRHEDVSMVVLRDVCSTLIRFTRSKLAETSERRQDPIVVLSALYRLQQPFYWSGAAAPMWTVASGLEGNRKELRYSRLRNQLAGQTANFAVRNEVRLGCGATPSDGEALVAFDAEGAWEVERLRVGTRAMVGCGDAMLRILSMWTLSKPELLRASGTLNKAYALFLRGLHRQKQWLSSVPTVARLIDFHLQRAPMEFLGTADTAPLEDARSATVHGLRHATCAAYSFVPVEPHVTTSVSVEGTAMKITKDGAIGRLVFDRKPTMAPCDAAAAAGESVALCQPQVHRHWSFVSTSQGSSTETMTVHPCPLCDVLPLLAKEGLCLMGGHVSLTHRKTYGSFSEYGIFPKGFDAYDTFSLQEGTVAGIAQWNRFTEPSPYNPVDESDEDKPRVMPTLVPVRLKRAK